MWPSCDGEQETGDAFAWSDVWEMVLVLVVVVVVMLPLLALV